MRIPIFALFILQFAFSPAVSATPGVFLSAADGRQSFITEFIEVGALHVATDDLADVVVRDLGGGTHDLTVIARTDLSGFSYPWTFDKRLNDYVIYEPFKMGQRWPASQLKEWGWRVTPYPGHAFAPLLIAEHADGIRLLHAADWPPQPVEMMFSAGRELIRWQSPTTRGDVAVARYRDIELPGTWHNGVRAYRGFIMPKLIGAGLIDAPPAWLTRAHGFYNIQLENMIAFDIAAIQRRADEWGDVLPWFQFWGQMSNYTGPPHLAVPPLQPGEEVGCCLKSESFHPRYLPDLPNWVRSYVNRGSRRVGFYVQPRPELHPVDEDPRHRLQLRRWADGLKDFTDANATYVDVVGAANFGAPLHVADELRRLGPNIFIESVDICLPQPALISGSYQSSLAFPRFGRFLLRDKAIFLGGSNNGYLDWGADNDHVQERRAFLLGAKFDAIHPNAVMRQICELRDKHKWWQRGPSYLDTDRLVPDAAIDAKYDRRLFVDRDGINLEVRTTKPGTAAEFDIIESPSMHTPLSIATESD